MSRLHCFAKPSEMPGSSELWQVQYAVMQELFGAFAWSQAARV